MNDTNEVLWHQVLFAAETDLKGISPLTLEEINLLKDNPQLHLAALKQKKQNVEYQFSNHRLIMLKYYQDYRLKKITLEEYEEFRTEQIAWKTKAASFLSRIEQKMAEIKLFKTYDY
jgi:hypothetical protein